MKSTIADAPPIYQQCFIETASTLLAESEVIAK